MSCDKEILSVENKLNDKELKIGDSHGVASGNEGKEVGVKCEYNSD